MIRRVVLMALLLFPISFLAGQELDENNFDQYTTASGLSHNAISGITQDSTGYIWVATSSGLNRFNGSRFVQFHSNNDSLSMASEWLNGMTWLSKNQLAVYTAGLHIINTKTGTTRNLFIPYHNLQYQYKFNMLVKVIGDEQGNIYVLTRSGFYHYDKNHKLVSRFDFYSEEEVPVSHFFFGRDLMELDAKRFLIVSIDGLYIYDKVKKKVRKMLADDSQLMAEFLNYPAVSYAFFQHKPGEIFIVKSASDSLVYVDIRNNRKVVSNVPINPTKKEIAWRSRLVPVNDTTFYLTGQYSGFFKLSFHPTTGVVDFSPEKYFPHFLCNTLFTDKDNQLWIATNKGLFRQNPQRSLMQLATLSPGMEDSFPDIKFDDICVTGDKLFASTRAGGGLLVYDKKTLQLEKQVLAPLYNKLSYNTAYAAMVFKPSTVLIGTGGPLILYNHTTKKTSWFLIPDWQEGIWTNDLYKDRKGNVWIGSYNIYRYNPVHNSFKLIRADDRLLRVPFVIQEDTSGHIWVGGHGLARYNTQLDTIDILLDSFPYTKMPDKQVNAIAVDRNNTVWFNSNNNGLIGYNISKRTFRQFTRKDGLPDDNISSIINVGDYLWIACVSGVACLDLKNLQIVSFGKEDGFPDMPAVKGARFFYDKDEEQLYMSFSNAIAKFNPFAMLEKQSSPHIFIESLVIGGKKNTFLPEQNITTSWQDNEVRITIGTINFFNGSSQRFAYRIVRDSLSPWINLGSQPSFNISSLSPGRHRIQVKAISPNNRWKEQVKEMTIVVLPPLWQQGWFQALAGVVAVVLLYLLIRWRTTVAREKEMEKTHIEKLKADDYKNQFELEQISNYFSSSLAGKKTEDEVLWDVTNNLIGRMNYVDCMIYLWNEDKTKMVQKAAYGPKGKPELITHHHFDVLPGQGIVGHVIETRQPVLVNDTRIDKRYRVDDAFRLSEVCVPIIHNDELMGILDSEHYLPNYFSDRDIKILTTIATLIGNKLKQIESEQSLAEKHQELATINEQLAEARLAALQAQMNPHFVFNALNSIKRMILDGDNEKASRYLSKFALMIRMTLNHSKEIFVTLDENIEYLRAYLEMEQLRFDESFTYKIFTSDNIEAAETPIPSMMMQPLVENAIWHGLMQTTSSKKIMIGFAQEENKIICTVEDNGIGIREAEKLKAKTKPPHHSVGLENLQKRIKIMNEKYDMDCKLIICDLGETGKNGTGTRVTLQFNLINV